MMHHTHVLICLECPLPKGLADFRAWGNGRCPACQHFYCRNMDCLRRLRVSEYESMVSCRSCGTPHRFSGRGFGKHCVDEPLLGRCGLLIDSRQPFDLN